MKYKKLSDDTYIFRLEVGEDIVEEIESFCNDLDINAAEIKGIGALKEIEIKHYSVERQEYSAKEYHEELEICSLYGLVTSIGLHAHIIVANNKMNTFGGHLSKGVIGATCEGTIKILPGQLDRKHDDQTGLKILDI